MGTTMDLVAQRLGAWDVAAFCERHGIERLAVFGSVLTDDFGPDSDVDVLVRLDRRRQPDLYDLLQVRDDLQTLWGRPVDVIEEEGLRNPYRRRRIEQTRRILYDAA